MNTILEKCLEEEKKLQFDSFSNEDALTLGLMIIEIVKTQYQNGEKRGVAIHIERNAQTLFTYFMDGSSYENDSWYKRKKHVVERYNHSSMYIGEIFMAKGSTVNAASFLPECEYQAVGGSFPIFIKDTGAVGTLSISGLTSEEDHDICVTALTQLLDSKKK